MADWKQITARIRRARAGKDPAGQLTNLFSKTRDAMVAFELARFFETNGNTADAGRWYLTAAERFRRADWKTKAQESAARLGATEPAEIQAPPPRSQETAVIPEPPAEAAPVEDSTASEFQVAEQPAPAQEAAPERSARPANRQRRGRRGGRERRPQKAAQHSAPPRESSPSPARERAEEPREPAERPQHIPSLESLAEGPSTATLRGRSGDPGLASRLTQLEMNFRRLLACAPTKLENADKAPAGPGVWVLTDSDLTTYYYVEPCQTLRVAIPNLLRSGAARRGESIKPLLAEHLGIPETRVAKYLSDHCVVRWLQMDEDAAHFAHFLIAVLRPALNS
jgi:hypothetical protein